ncbi:MAG: DMT family transporter [Pseudomonadota bacterium]
MKIAKPSASVGVGVILMAVASLSVSIVDGTAKVLAQEHSPYLIAWVRYAVAFLVVLPFALARFGLRVFPRRNLFMHALRTVFLVSAMTFFFVSLQTTELANAIVAFFVGPVIALFLAVLLLGETLNRANLASLICGFVGVAIAIRPTESPTMGTVLALAAGVCLAFYLVATRVTGRQSDPLRTLVFQCGFGALLLLPLAFPYFRLPAPDQAGLFLLLGCVSAVVHLMVIRAFQLAPATTLAPLVYLELIGASLVGFAVFGDIPDRDTVVGAVLITLSGLLAWRASGGKTDAAMGSDRL